MEIIFDGIICFVLKSPGKYDAVLPDGRDGVQPCSDIPLEPHYARIEVPESQVVSQAWTGATRQDGKWIFPIMERGEITIGSIGSGPGVTGALNWQKGIYHLTAYQADLQITPGYPKSIAQIGVAEGTPSWDHGPYGVGFTRLALTSVQRTVAGRAGLFMATPDAVIDVRNESAHDIDPHNQSHFFLHYRLASNAKRPCKAPQHHTEALHADCSNSGYP